MPRFPRPARLTTLGAFALTLALAACGKATEVAVEKAIEREAAKDGVQAKVDLAGGQARVTTTDAQGQTSKMELGNAGVTEAELGVPLYPGARVEPGSTSRVDTPEGKMVMMQFETDDAADKVAAFYRDLLKQRAAGKALMDASTGDGGATLMLGDEATKSGLQIQVSKLDKGSAVIISSTQGKR